MIKNMKVYISVLCIAILTIVIFLKWPSEKNLWFSKEIKENNLEIKAKEYYRKSGKYLMISGKFKNNDTLFEYVLYSQPFGLGPLKDQNPIKRITIGKGAIQEKNYYICLSKKDSLFDDKQSFLFTQNDFTILKSFDSLLKTYNSLYINYQRKYQNMLENSKQIFSETDDGLFAPLSQE